jgi:Cu/Ag efflux protein CusF
MANQHGSVAGAFMVAAVLTALGGCGGKAPAPRADVYSVRGVVEKLPEAGSPDKSIYIHHAAVPGYRDESGKVIGMESMTMPFPLAPDVSLAGIAPGDPVEFTLSVTWRPQAGYRITAIHKLPPGTEIDFQPKEPGPG